MGLVRQRKHTNTPGLPALFGCSFIPHATDGFEVCSALQPRLSLLLGPSSTSFPTMDDPKVVATGHSPLRPNQPINGLDIPLTGISTPHNVDLATSPTSAPVPFFPPAANATQPQTMATSTSPTLIAIPSPALTQPTLDSVFREYLYRSCRDSLFWLEAGM